MNKLFIFVAIFLLACVCINCDKHKVSDVQKNPSNDYIEGVNVDLGGGQYEVRLVTSLKGVKQVNVVDTVLKAECPKEFVYNMTKSVCEGGSVEELLTQKPDARGSYRMVETYVRLIFFNGSNAQLYSIWDTDGRLPFYKAVQEPVTQSWWTDFYESTEGYFTHAGFGGYPYIGGVTGNAYIFTPNLSSNGYLTFMLSMYINGQYRYVICNQVSAAPNSYTRVFFDQEVKPFFVAGTDFYSVPIAKAYCKYDVK